MFPSSKGQDGGLSSRECRVESGRECHGDVAQAREHSPRTRTIWVRLPSSPPFHSLMRGGRARRSGRRNRRFDSCRRDQQLSGRPRGRAPDRNPEVGSFREGSNPSRSTISSPRSSADERAVTAREVEGSNPSGGPIYGAVTQRTEYPPVQRRAAGSNPASVATTRRVTQRGRVADS